MQAKIHVLKDVGTHKIGAIVDVEVDEDGIPLNSFWRKRLKDAEIDNCVELKLNKPVKGVK